MKAMRHHFYLELIRQKYLRTFRVGFLKGAFYGTSKFLLALCFCEALLVIVQVNKSMRNAK